MADSRMLLLEVWRTAQTRGGDGCMAVATLCMKALDMLGERIQNRTTNGLKDIIDHVTPYVETSRMCFAFIKALMCANQLPMDDFQRAADVINDLYAGQYKWKIDVKDMECRLNVQTFRKHPSMWKEDDAPVSGKRFKKYMNIANMTLEMAKNFH